MFIKYKSVIYLRQYIFLYMTCSYPTKKILRTNSNKLLTNIYCSAIIMASICER